MNYISKKFSRLVPLCLFVAACGSKSAVIDSQTQSAASPRNDLTRISDTFETTFNKIPLNGKLASIPWSGDYWAVNKGMIAFRWQDPSDNAFSRDFLTEPQVRKMSQAELAKLSPAEKYDILVESFSFKLTRNVLAKSNPNALSWEGICDGWSAAASFYREPKAVTLRSKTGIEIPFGSDDIKALLSYQVSHASMGANQMVGSKCVSALDNGNCDSLDARAFHVLLGNQIGLRGQAVLLDVSTGDEVWNHPAHTYGMTVKDDKKIRSADSAPGTTREVIIETVLSYTVETAPSWDVQSLPVSTEKIYKYRLELNDAGTIVGSKWLQQDTPDYIVITKKPKFSGYFNQLNDVYSASTSTPLIENEKTRFLGTCREFDKKPLDCSMVGFPDCRYDDAKNRCEAKSGIEFNLPDILTPAPIVRPAPAPVTPPVLGTAENAIGKLCRITSSPFGTDANIRDSANGKIIASLPDGFFPVKIRGFVGEFASIEAKTASVGELGAHIRKPAFIHKSQFDFSKCK